LFFDIKTKFSDVTAKFPNTIPQKNQFEQEVKALGVNKDSKVVIYDDLGIYSSPRAWWLFKIFGFDNVCILNGGLPEWKKQHGFTVSKYKISKYLGNFEANYKCNKVVLISDLPAIFINKNTSIIDARSDARFHCMVPEPRMGLRSGTIPNSLNLPFSQLLENGLLKSKAALQTEFARRTKNRNLVFTCGSGITACILYLAAQEAGYKTLKLYDGSWTEYGSLIKP
jgi:thiosulfate/3-mercaptopyruvate sulfurtransferase